LTILFALGMASPPTSPTNRNVPPADAREEHARNEGETAREGQDDIMAFLEATHNEVDQLYELDTPQISLPTSSTVAALGPTLRTTPPVFVSPSCKNILRLDSEHSFATACYGRIAFLVFGHDDGLRDPAHDPRSTRA